MENYYLVHATDAEASFFYQLQLSVHIMDP